MWTEFLFKDKDKTTLLRVNNKSVIGIAFTFYVILDRYHVVIFFGDEHTHAHTYMKINKIEKLKCVANILHFPRLFQCRIKKHVTVNFFGLTFEICS